MVESMAPPLPVDSPSGEESTVPLKKARRGKGSGSVSIAAAANVRVPPREGRKRPSSMGRDDDQQGSTSNSQSQPTSAGGFTPLQHPQSSTPMPPGKMLLPRLPLPKSSTPDMKAAGKERTSHACDKCRKAKAKCSGGQPCDKCRAEGRECIYGDGKRDKVRKEMENLNKQNRDLQKQSRGLVAFLRGMREDPKVPIETTEEIDEYLSKLNLVDPDAGDDDKRRGSGDTGEDDADAQEVASMGSLDAINEDTNRDEATRAAGYLGKSSAVRWVQRTKDYLDHDGHENTDSQKDAKNPGNAFMDASCHADDRDYPEISTQSVTADELPPLQHAQTLVDAYFKHVHPALPIVSEHDFRESFNEYVVQSNSNSVSPVGTKQQNFCCCMNMVFAIAARHAEVIGAEYQHETNHLTFFARACGLGLDKKALHEDAELENTTSLGLVSLYFLTLEHINRAWTWAGVALRSALTLGLHLRSQTRSLTDVDKEYRLRIFWCLYSLERVLNQLTGRPSCISPRDICANTPVNIDESKFKRGVGLYDEDRNSKSEFYGASAEAAAKAVPRVPRSLPADSSRSEGDCSPMDTSPVSKFSSMTSTTDSHRSPDVSSNVAVKAQEMTSSTYFFHHIRLSIISHEVFQDLYSPTMVNGKWGDIQNVIRRIDISLRRWRESLPWQYRFNPENPRSASPPEWQVGEQTKDPNQRRDQWKQYAGQRIGLAMMWSSSRMMLYRPTLCRISNEIKNESDKSKTFNSDSAASCVRSARNMIACFPPFDHDQHHKRSHSYHSEEQFGSDLVSIHSFVPWWNTSHYLIECSSVLIMELAYRADHVPSQAEALFEDTKTAVSWMRHLAPQSPMARKGSKVYELLLRRVAPRIGRDAGSLSKDGNLSDYEQRSSRSQGDDNDTSTDTIRWSGHAESAARFEHHPNPGYNHSSNMQPQQHAYGSPMGHQQHHLSYHQTSAPSPRTTFGQPSASMPAATQLNDFSFGGASSLGLDALPDFHFAGNVFGVYDQFGPWVNHSLENFGMFDPVVDARLGGGNDMVFDGSQTQNHSSISSNSHMSGGSGHIVQAPPIMTQNLGSQQQMPHSQYSPLANVSMLPGDPSSGAQAGMQMTREAHMQMPGHHINSAGAIGVSTDVAMPSLSASDMGYGRSYTYNATTAQNQQLPSMQQIGVGPMGGAQQGGGYAAASYGWDGPVRPVGQQLGPQMPQYQPQPQQHTFPALHAGEMGGVNQLGGGPPGHSAGSGKDSREGYR